MPGVNGIQFTPSSYLRPQLDSGGELRNDKARNEGQTGDIYSAGSEAWRNKAVSSTEQTVCRCGNCPACAAQAYASQGQRLGGEDQGDRATSGPVQESEGSGREEDGLTTNTELKGVDGEVLSQQEQKQLVELKKADRAVRAHEQAHVAAAGSLVRRGVSLSYEKGPDGRRYAVAGEVSIDTSKEADPADTITKMRTVRAAALAPVEPSPQDRKVAAAATVTMTDAMSELQLARSAEEKGENAVAQAAEELAGNESEQGGSEQAMSAGAAPGESNRFSPRHSRAMQRYSARGQAQAQSLTTTV